MAADGSWVNAMRAEALAKIYLTRSDELEVIPISRYAQEPSYDLLVRVKRQNGGHTPAFGVETRGTRQPLGPKRLRSFLPDALKQVGASDLPVCLFVFNVETEEGFYRWLKEPVIAPTNGSGPLVRLELRWPNEDRSNGAGGDESFDKLDTNAVRHITDRVVQWYEAKDRVTIASPARR